MIKLFSGMVAAALIIAVAMVLLWPVHAFAAACAGTVGTASWYGAETCHRGRPCLTATGTHFTGNSMTAAMPSRSRLGDRVKVTLLSTGKSVVVLVDDIGPVRSLHRAIDLSHAAALRLGMQGIGRVCIEDSS